MTEQERFKLGDFDSVCEMLELLNTQRLVISDMEKENEDLKRKHYNELMEEGVKIERLKKENKELKKENKELKCLLNYYKSN